MARIFKHVITRRTDSPAQFLARILRTLEKDPRAEVILDDAIGGTESAMRKYMSDLTSLDAWDPEKYLIGMGQLWDEVMGVDKNGNETPKTDPKTGQTELAPVLVEVTKGPKKGTKVPAWSLFAQLLDPPAVETPEGETPTEGDPATA